jgi:hypothetical protein
MTDAEWLACTGWEKLLARVVGPGAGRKLRLFGCACCRRLWHLIWVNECRVAVELAERYADGFVEKAELMEAAADAIRVTDGKRFYTRTTGAEGERVRRAALAFRFACTAADRINTLTHDVTTAVRRLTRAEYDTDAPQPVHADLVRDIFGNPFRPVALSSSWRTDTAVTLAQQMYESRDFGAMPILADALQDAGCDRAEILDHCRGPGPHVRGCWVVDLVLGKQ